MQSPIQHSISYNNQVLSLKQLWQVPQQNRQFAIIEFKGMNVETGYIKQDPVFLTFTQKPAC